nr:helix-hairpin-helix domain-containing protein [uncultured Desulfobulbus sp.]
MVDLWSVGHNADDGQYGFHPQSSPHLLRFNTNKNINDYIPLSPNGIRNKAIAARYALFIFEPLAINRASQQELTLLPGIGVQLAKNIQHHIALHGALKNAADLSQIHGIGPQKARKLLPLITFLQDD